MRVREPARTGQRVMVDLSEDSLPLEHPARLLWTVLGHMDLSAFTAGAKAVEGHVGRSVLSPRMLLTLWGYALSEGLSSARRIAALTRRDAVYAWIVADQRVGHHKLSGFLQAHGAALERLLSDVLGVLIHRGLLSLRQLSQDGVRVRASAGASSFRTERGLQGCREQAALHLRAVLAEADDPALSRRQRAAREAGARAVVARVDAAIAVAKGLQAKAGAGRDKGRATRPAKASTSDPEARRMRMADGGTRPAYNVRLCVAGDEFGGPRTIVAVDATQEGNDRGALAPMWTEVQARTGQRPERWMADSDHFTVADVQAAAAAGIALYMPLDKTPAPGAVRDPAIDALRARMADPESQRRYRVRASLSELGNANVTTRFGLTRLRVRGRQQVQARFVLAAIAFDLLQHGPRLLH